jgi:drug/metabolite transporter (DMT)-like permease
MVASALCFSVMTALVKAAGQRLPSQEIVLARAAVALVLSWLLLRRAGVAPWGTRRGLLLLRGTFGFLGLTCVFYAVTHLPIAEATVIQYLHPVFTALLAAPFLGERAGRALVGGVALSLLGVAAVARPDALLAGAAGLDPMALAAAVGGAFFSGCAYVTVRKLSATEHPLVIVLYFPLVATPASIPAVLPVFVMPRGLEWLLLLGVGVFTQLGQVAITRGLQHEPAGRATALSYLQVPFAALWGVLFFAEVPDVWTLCGAALILGGTLLAIADARREEAGVRGAEAAR